ncbi:MAG: class I SAM-dependent methyltransferase [Bacteroidetes bacterium]|nr:class I SAM-dependent methyltransferase [Bacteroidota bacterium]MBT5529055.1 class I SAM-dependent methyltransferase [Cytophagia bacterium]MBT3423035.1 class I SAM-dependent methyltransferase [Bacteroidota bacterium]MBT3801755.1 class I SAM-dependent methyltransferase [Bacteroidota bacterium]MBT3934758.1 class I SAM-dependent methyltransferase [Bacteroidota bacterium]
MKELWNQRYAEDEYIYGTAPNMLVKEFIDQAEAGKILFAAEGEGRNAVYAAKHNWQVDAVDYSEEGRKKALLLAKQENVTINYTVSDILNYELEENKYDAIALIYFHMPPTIRQEIHQRMINALKPKGHILLMAFDKKQINNDSGGPKKIELLYNKELIEDDFKGLNFLKFEEKELHLEEGTFHSGISDNILLIAQKP